MPQTQRIKGKQEDNETVEKVKSSKQIGMKETKSSTEKRTISKSSGEKTAGSKASSTSGRKLSANSKTSSFGNKKVSSNNKKSSSNSRKSHNNDAEVKVLNELYKNAGTGKLSVDNVIKKIEDTDLRNLLLNHYEDYNEISNKIASQLRKNGVMPKENNVFGKAVLWGSINMNTLFDKTPSHIADIMIQGNNSGIVSINKELNSNSDSLSPNTLRLASELISLEQKNVRDLTTYL